MSFKTYTVAMRNGPIVTRKGHIVTFTRADQPAVAVALYKTRGGYNADHPRTGRSISAFDQVCRFGKAVLLREAKDSLNGAGRDERRRSVAPLGRQLCHPQPRIFIDQGPDYNSR